MSELVKFALVSVAAYLLGSLPAAYLVTKWSRGIDLRRFGSGNVGWTNVMVATHSRWLGLPVLVFDVGKGALAVYAARWVGLPLYLQGFAGVAAVIGHNWPVFLGFNGGRGVLTTLGTAIAVEPRLTFVLLLLSFTGIPFHLLPLTALVAILLLPVLTWLSSLPVINAFFPSPLGEQRMALVLFFVCLFLITMVRRLTASLSPLAVTVSRGELLVNRLLYDRDIRDRKVWVQRGVAEPVAGDAGKHSE